MVVGAVNALNLLDGIDGLATILGSILCVTIAALALMTGHPAVAMVALVFSGSLLGFCGTIFLRPGSFSATAAACSSG